MNSVTYNAPPTIAKFMRDPALVRIVVGPVGSGKTTGMVMELCRRMTDEYPDARGIRKTRFGIIRNTSAQLRQTVLPEIEKWLSAAFRYKVTDSTLLFSFPLPDGTKVESEWLLIPMDEPRDVQRLLSLNLTGAWGSEARELPLQVIEALLGRVGRYKSIGVDQCKWMGIILETNPPDEDSEWHKRLEIDRPSKWQVFKQPGGLEDTAENTQYLPVGYYQNLIENNTSDWCDVFVHAKYGKSLSGQAVFRSSFRPEFHLVDGGLKLTEGYPLMVAQDFGRTPAALITQIDVRGRLLVLAEQTSTDMGIEQFTQVLLKPSLARKFPGSPVFIVADPAGRQKSQVGEESPFDALQRLGFRAYAAPTNDIDARLRAVEQLFLRNVDGGPAIVIDSTACPILTRALKFEYRYRRKQTGGLEEKPEKTHPASDLADCLQYAALGATGNYTAQVISDSKPRPRRAAMSVRAWT